MQRSQRTGEATCSTSRSTKSAPEVTLAPSRLDQSVTRRVGGLDRRRGLTERIDGRSHVAGVEGAGDLQGDHPRAGRRLGRQGLQGGERAGGDELAAAVVVRRGEVELLEPGDDGCLVPADHGAHAGLLGGGGLGHRAPADADEAQRVLLAEHAGGRSGGELADRVAGHAGDGAAVARARPTRAGWPRR